MPIDFDTPFESPSQPESSASSLNKDPVKPPSENQSTPSSTVRKTVTCSVNISPISLVNPSNNDNIVQLKFNGKTLFASPLPEDPEELEKILEEGNVGAVSYDENGNPIVRTPAGFETQGITEAEFHNPDGTTTTHASVRFETLSDKELAALKSQIKARIVYLKLSDPDNKEKRDNELKHLEILLKFVESEEALRNKNLDKFRRLNGKQINTISKMEAKWSALRAMQNANQEIREARAEEKQETVRVIVKQKVMKEEIIKEGVLFARILGKTVLESKEAKESNEETQNGSKIKTVDYVSISPTINKNPRRVFVNMGSLLIRYRSI